MTLLLEQAEPAHLGVFLPARRCPSMVRGRASTLQLHACSPCCFHKLLAGWCLGEVLRQAVCPAGPIAALAVLLSSPAFSCSFSFFCFLRCVLVVLSSVQEVFYVLRLGRPLTLPACHRPLPILNCLAFPCAIISITVGAVRQSVASLLVTTPSLWHAWEEQASMHQGRGEGQLLHGYCVLSFALALSPVFFVYDDDLCRNRCRD